LLVQTEESTLNTKRLFVGIIQTLVLVNSEWQILSCALPQTFSRGCNKEEELTTRRCYWNRGENNSWLSSYTVVS